MKNLVKWKEGEQSWIRLIKNKLSGQLNELSIITGETGSGKTYFAMSMACLLDPEFNPQEQIAFNFLDLMRIINNFNDPKHPLSKKKFKVSIFDEPQTSISATAWNSKVNRTFNALASTFRHQHICLLFATPYSNFIDSSTRRLLHSEIRCIGWNRNTKTSTTRPLILQYNSNKNKTYFHSLYVVKDGRANKMRNWTLPMPPKHIYEPYEVMKTNFTNKLNAKITKELEREEGILNEKDGHNRKPLTDIQAETMRIIAKYDGNMKKAIEVIGKSANTVYFHRNKAEKKGFVFQEFKEGGLNAK